MTRWLDAWRRLRLGTRLALALGALALVVFATVGTVMVGIMQDYFGRRLDEQLTKSQLEQLSRLRNEHSSPQAAYSWYSSVFEVNGTTVTAKPGGALPPRYDELSEIALQAVKGDMMTTVSLHDLGAYRVRACPIEAGEVLLSAAPKNDLDKTVNQLILVEVVAFVLALGVLVVAGRIVLKRGLRPLSSMAATAHYITSHDLTDSANVPVRAQASGGGVEVAELRTAFNLMLDHIDSSFAARAAANERLRRFVADASHELRTPLTSIRGYADLFRYAAANEPAERDAHLAKIREETARMSVLVDDLLLLARLDEPGAEPPIRRQEIDAAELAAQAAQAFEAAHQERPLTLEIGGGPHAITADPVRLRQVLDNLLTNAAVHTPAGTPVTVSVETDGEEVLLSVTDEGPGIPAEALARIFDRFYRVDDSRARGATGTGGTGLGLAVVQSLAEAHGGHVDVESGPGRTRFTVRLQARS
ncbi:HAMP domain-containing sensor histidine kinase [Amycolatopsis minnesotensis]|uniref:histidine kinase n=1 Tax=Amycolatopsis minnesotensis TaxID=337894 RepID=A0ABP5DSL4_9PSEU